MKCAFLILLWVVGLGTLSAQNPGPAVTGAIATPLIHGINLSWTASVTPGVTYNVYRSGGSGGPYTQIASGLAVLSFTNSGLPSSTTFYYVVTSVDVNGESSYSNQASATTL